MAKRSIVQIEDVTEPFCGIRRKDTVSLLEAEPEISLEWLYKRNAGWGPEDLSRCSGVNCWWRCSKCMRKYKTRICSRTSAKTRSGCPYCASKKVCSDNALVEHAPEIAQEWHPTKNGKLKATDFMRASSKHVWWKCSTCGHSWQAAVADRTTLGSGCPACYEARMQYAREHPKPYIQKPVILGEKKKVSRAWYEKPSSADFKSIIETDYSIAKQWHPTKNGEWRAFDFTRGSDAVAWWRCKKGPDHEWQAVINSRTLRKSRCPFCSGKRVSITNNLKKRFPEIAKEWHPKLNSKTKPEDVTYGSGKKYWWRCKKDPKHEWRATVSIRTGQGRGCPYCAGQKVSSKNSLKANFPYIARQLHPTKNKGLTGDDIAAGSSKLIWWVCKDNPDHVWQATPANRTARGSNCPFCAGRKVSRVNSLAALFPEIAKQWDTRKNKTLRPDSVTAHSSRKVFWQCEEGHSWLQAIGKRTNTTGTCYECRTGKARPTERRAIKVIPKRRRKGNSPQK